MNQIWNIGEVKNCFFCLAPSSMSFRISKKGGAYLTCRCCGSRAFLHGDGTKGPEMIFGPMSLAMRDDKPEVAAKIHEIAVAKENPSEQPVASS